METKKVAAPSIALPKGGSPIRSTGETFQPNAFTGTGTLSFPFACTDGRGISPELTLNYSSGTENGPFGAGFAMPLPNITRRTSRGVPLYNESDFFVLSGSDDLVPALLPTTEGWLPEQRTEEIGGEQWNVASYRPQLEKDFSSIEWWQNPESGESFWKTISSDNVASYYGRTANARIADPADMTRIFSWLIERSEDARGNVVQYMYKEENKVNVPDTIYEQGRIVAANRYIDTIRYGNYYTGDGEESFAFEVVFDYGQYDLLHPELPPGEWPSRPDPFSSYRAGFEIRTYRLCRAVMMFHRFSEENNGERFLVQAMKFGYAESSVLSLLISTQTVGYRRRADGLYAIQELPPVEFTYEAFQPEGREFQQMLFSANVQPGVPGADYLVADLYGEGIPGILYSDSTTTLYWEANGNGVYSYPEVPSRFPIDRDLAGGSATLVDVDGDGRLDIVVSNTARKGFYGNSNTGAWLPYREFLSAPAAVGQPGTDILDVNGDGLADIVQMSRGQFLYYLSMGELGYGQPIEASLAEDFPMGGVDTSQYVSFADMFGDGMAHRVRISSGTVECWPNMGYGHFGHSVLFGNAPQFDAGFEPGRLFLVDVNGTGVVDIVYAYEDRIEIYLNNSGNSFSEEPIVIALPVPFGSTGSLTFGDVTGSGSTSMILTALTPDVRHLYYDFAPGGHSYFLTGVNNNLGAETAIYYESSVQFYLRDKQAGRPWLTRMPFPVQVVERIESIDYIAGSKDVMVYAYHDGYYDPVAREFRGFGFVESWDSQTFEDFTNTGLRAQNLDTGGSALFVGTLYRKTWYNTGAYMESGLLSKQYQSEYYQGDPDEYAMPDSVLDPAITQSSPQTIREAYSALRGQVMRDEVYGQNGSINDDVPYTVSESNFEVRLLQPASGRNAASFLVFSRETISYEYDRCPNDPRTRQEYTLVVDAFGYTTQSCQVLYPRREAEGRVVYPEQTELQCMASVSEVINITNPFRLLGVPAQSKRFEIRNLNLHGAMYFSYDEIKRQVQEALLVVTSGATNELSAKLLQWQRTYYWNEAQDDALPLGAVTARALLHHTADAVFSPGDITLAFGDKVNPQMLEVEGGYCLEDGYWWNRGLVQYYYTDGKQFFLPWKTENSFAPDDSPLRSKTTFSYDPYYLTPVEIKEYLTEEIVNVSSVKLDYNVMEAREYTDINGVVSQVEFDPIGSVVVSTLYGYQGADIVGDDDIATYELRELATFDDVLNHPEYYLQGMASYFFYDAYAWRRTRQPVAIISLVRQDFVSNESPENPCVIQQAITFVDGFGRLVEKKTLVESGAAVRHDARGNIVVNEAGLLQQSVEKRWVVSGRVVYNNKGTIAKEYLPYFTDQPEYEDQRSIEDLILPPPTKYFYDPLLRVVRIDTPKGFFSKTEFSPWESWLYDEDDTVLDSQYYIEHFSTTTPAERAALEQAARFYNTPQIQVLNVAGEAFLTIDNNLGKVAPDAFTAIVGNTGITSAELWQALVDALYLTAEGWVTPKFQPYVPGFEMVLPAPYEQFVPQLIPMLKQNCLTSYSLLDVEGNVLEVADPRLYYSNITEGTQYYNFRYLYSLNSDTLVVDSADAGIRWNLNNMFGNPIYSWDMRDFCIFRSYDRFQRPLTVHVSGDDGRGLSMDKTVERFEYGEYADDSEHRNLRGQVYLQYDQAGVQTTQLYSIMGEPVIVQRELVANYTTEPDWANPGSVVLDPEVFETQQTFNAVGGLLTQSTTPDKSVYSSAYGVSGDLQSVSVAFDDGVTQSFIDSIEYNANRQPLTQNYGNGVQTLYTYEDTTERLLTIYSTRPADSVPSDSSSAALGEVLQNITYTYDPVGNITRTVDTSYETIFCDQQIVEPQSNYTYDALYRLLQATGRQHPGILKDTHITGFKQTLFMPFCPPHRNDMDKLQNYTEYYSYDDGGNMTEFRHVAPPGLPNTSWTRRFTMPANSNRATLDGGPTIQYDANGNMLDLDNAAGMQWSYRNTLSRIDTILRGDDVSDSDYYVYDGDGNRIRKVTERYTNGGTTIEIEEKIYLGMLEIKRLRQKTATPSAPYMERWSLHVEGSGSNVAMTHYWAVDERNREGGTGARAFRFQLYDTLGSSAVEVDQNAAVISYEEYFPFGDTAVIAGNSEVEVSPKDYRYSGKERDDSSGFYYYGARYYAPWIARWISPDPAGATDGLNLYAFVQGNPVSYVDSGGFARSKPKTRSSKRYTKALKRRFDTVSLFKPHKRFHSFGKSSLAILPKGFRWRRDTTTNEWILEASGVKASKVLSRLYGRDTDSDEAILHIENYKSTFYVPKSSNSGVGLTRDYPMTNDNYRAVITSNSPKIRTKKSMFSAVPSGQIGYVRGHLIPHADTKRVTPLSGGVMSTTDAFDYYPEPEGWGEQQRKHREMKARKRGVPIQQLNIYSSNPEKTLDGTPIPSEIYFIEYTSLAADQTYAKSKSYDMKAYHLVYKGFDYDSLAPAASSKSGTRKSLKTLRVPYAQIPRPEVV